ncbi:hypothetical protein, partial [Klebsiella pneumoniae]|uniref:hypothetical protein n=1 Tax=Klebsiella pneumoniae TaxID=573 RepID=UPI0019532595
RRPGRGGADRTGTAELASERSKYSKARPFERPSFRLAAPLTGAFLFEPFAQTQRFGAAIRYRNPLEVFTP